MNALTEYEVGKFYRVPCVKIIRHDGYFRMGSDVPILGPAHEDAEHINFPYDHWHIDWRFWPKQTWERLPVYRSVLGIVLHVAPRPWPHGKPMPNTDGTIRMLRRKCHRAMPEYPPEKPVPWLKPLADAYETARLKCNICPHRGLPLDGLPVVDGVVTCPGHGLAWHVKDGTLCRKT